MRIERVWENLYKLENRVGPTKRGQLEFGKQLYRRCIVVNGSDSYMFVRFVKQPIRMIDFSLNNSTGC